LGEGYFDAVTEFVDVGICLRWLVSSFCPVSGIRGE